MSQQNLEPDVPERLRELAASDVEPQWEAIEQRLLGAFAARHARDAWWPAAPERRPVAAAMWRVGAAAAVVLAAAITFYPRPEPRPVPPPKPTPAPRGAPVAPPQTKPPQTAPQTSAPPAAPQTNSRVGVPSLKPVPALEVPPVEAATSAVSSRPASFEDFIALPGASALPDFESGRIMRVEIPLTGLPAYGLDMVLDATPGTIEADVLVGQDGVARAIRLASTESH